MTPDENIQMALFKHVADEVDEAPIAWPNRSFSPPDTGIYIQVTHFRNQNERLFLDGSDPHWRRGLLQLSIRSPINKGDQIALASAVAGHFPADLLLYSEDVKVRIARAPDMMSPIQTDVAWLVPVSIYYEAFV